MNRRGFLTVLAGVGVSVALPLKVLLPELKSHQFKRHTEMFDWSTTRGIGVSLTQANGTRYRHAFAIPEQHWQSLTRGQREAMWRRLEAMVLDRARGIV
jgi:hypothetical protein